MVRIHLVAVPPLIDDIAMHILAHHVQVASITRFLTPEALTVATSGSPADIVLVGPNSDANQLAAQLVGTGHARKAIAFSPDGRSAWIYRAGAEATVLTDFSPHDLRTAVLSD